MFPRTVIFITIDKIYNQKSKNKIAGPTSMKDLQLPTHHNIPNKHQQQVNQTSFNHLLVYLT